MSTPNPGSDAALGQGCTCPVIDNGHGRGMGGGTITHPESGLPIFVYNWDCPLHGQGNWTDDGRYEPPA